MFVVEELYRNQNNLVDIDIVLQELFHPYNYYYCSKESELSTSIGFSDFPAFSQIRRICLFRICDPKQISLRQLPTLAQL